MVSFLLNRQKKVSLGPGTLHISVVFLIRLQQKEVLSGQHLTQGLKNNWLFFLPSEHFLTLQKSIFAVKIFVLALPLVTYWIMLFAAFNSIH